MYITTLAWVAMLCFGVQLFMHALPHKQHNPNFNTRTSTLNTQLQYGMGPATYIPYLCNNTTKSPSKDLVCKDAEEEGDLEGINNGPEWDVLELLEKIAQLRHRWIDEC